MLMKSTNSKEISKAAKGAALEHKAIAAMTELGMYVSKSVDPQCPFDLVAVDPESDRVSGRC